MTYFDVQDKVLAFHVGELGFVVTRKIILTSLALLLFITILYVKIQNIKNDNYDEVGEPM